MLCYSRYYVSRYVHELVWTNSTSIGIEVSSSELMDAMCVRKIASTMKIIVSKECHVTMATHLD